MILPSSIDDRIPGLVFGLLLIGGGIGMLRAQRLAARKLSAAEASIGERRFLTSRIRRRSQVAGMILLIGIMIPVGDSLIPWKRSPATFAIYWMIVIGLAFWTMLLAVADMAATRIHTTAQLNDLRRQQTQLEQAARAIRARQKNESEP